MKRLFFILLAGVWAMSVLGQSFDEEAGMRFYKDKQYEVAVPYLQKAAKAGSGIAQATLGEMYEKGLGVSKNYQIAMNMYKKAAESQEPVGLVGIGGLYANGLGVEKNQETAFSYYKRAADMGSALGEAFTGIYYLYGNGTEQNIEEALKYLERSTSGGFGNEILANLYFDGTVVEQDMNTAFKWYTSGDIDSYSAQSRYRLAGIYYKRYENYDKALELLDRLRREEYSGAADAYREVFQLQKESRMPDTAPSFPGGVMRYIASHLQYPDEAQENGIQGKVVLVFTVKKDGSVADIRVKQSAHPLLDKEAVRLIMSMPKWNPATTKGKPVDAEFTLPITFALG